jgi:hypothetical protein
MGINRHKACMTNVNCNVLPTSTGVKGPMLNGTMATIVTVSMANARSTSSATMAVVATTSTTTRRVFPSTRTRASSPDAYTASMPITCTTSAMLIRTTKHANNNNNLQTATKQTKKHTAAMARAPRLTRATIAGQAANQVAWQSQ